MTAEPHATALLLLVVGGLLAISAVSTRATERIGVPVLLVFLGLGMALGLVNTGHAPFRDYAFAYRLGTIALVLILFDGGLNTQLTAVRRALGPAGMLATVGVAGTAAIVAWGAHLLGFPWNQSWLIGAVVSSTDAAAVFSVLRGSGTGLKWRVGTTLEVESGINDPLAVILTMGLTQELLTPGVVGWSLLWSAVYQIGAGLAIGWAVGAGAQRLMLRVRLAGGGLYSVMSLATAFLSYALATLAGGSGFLAVYVTALLLGSRDLPFRTSILRVHDALAWLSQMVMFLVLGLLVSPTELAENAPLGIALALLLALIARPAVVALCLAPFRFTLRDVLYVGWVGLRGAVPIILAIYPILQGAPGAGRILHVVFGIVVVSALVPGGTVAWAARRMGLESTEPPRPPAILEIESAAPLNGELLPFFIDDALGLDGATLAELPFPETSSVTLVVRGQTLIAARGNTVLHSGDHVYVLTSPEDRPVVELIFGRPDE